MKNPRRIFRLVRFSVALLRGLVVFFVIALLFNIPITALFGSDMARLAIFGTMGLSLSGFAFMAVCQDIWHKAADRQEWQTENLAFLVEAHTDKLIPNLQQPTYEGGPTPSDPARVTITSTLYHMVRKMDAESVKQMTPQNRSAFVRLLTNDDVRIVRPVLEIVEQSLLVEALPLVRRLVNGKLKASSDIYTAAIAKRVLANLEARYAIIQQEQYLRPSAAPNDELLLPAASTAQSDNLLRPHKNRNNTEGSI